MEFEDLVAFAYSECGLSIDQFLSLSWYEWSLEIYKVKNRRKREFEEWEKQAVFVREQMALIANTNRDPKRTPRPYKGSDFFPLSFDDLKEIEVVKKRQTPEEVDARLSRYVKNAEKVNKNGK